MTKFDESNQTDAKNYSEEIIDLLRKVDAQIQGVSSLDLQK